MSPILDYRRDLLRDDARKPGRVSICGGLSFALFVATLWLFGLALLFDLPQSSHQEAFALLVISTPCTALLGFVFGVVALTRRERNRSLAWTGVVLNGVWLALCGLYLAVAYAIFGGMRGSDWH